MVLKNNNNQNYNYNLANNFNELAGGNYQEWKNFIEKLSQKLEKKIYGKNMGELEYALNNKFEQNPYRINPNVHLNNFDSLCNAVYNYLNEWENKTEGFLDQIMRYARLMTNKNQPFPIDFYNLNYNQFIYHMKWYKDNHYNVKTGKNYYGLKHRKDTIRMFLLAYGYILA